MSSTINMADALVTASFSYLSGEERGAAVLVCKQFKKGCDAHAKKDFRDFVESHDLMRELRRSQGRYNVFTALGKEILLTIPYLKMPKHPLGGLFGLVSAMFLSKPQLMKERRLPIAYFYEGVPVIMARVRDLGFTERAINSNKELFLRWTLSTHRFEFVIFDKPTSCCSRKRYTPVVGTVGTSEAERSCVEYLLRLIRGEACGHRAVEHRSEEGGSFPRDCSGLTEGPTTMRPGLFSCRKVSTVSLLDAQNRKPLSAKQLGWLREFEAEENKREAERNAEAESKAEAQGDSKESKAAQ